jgi:site-specific recombinase XerD
MSITGKSRGTIENYSRHVATLALHFGRVPLDLSIDEVHEYLYGLQKRSRTPSQSYFKHTVFGLRFLLKSEGLAYGHLLLPSIKTERRLPAVLSREEVWRMLCSDVPLKHRILIGILYGCGLRCSEVCNIRLRDLDFDRKVLHVVQGKGKKDRYLPLSDHLIRGLQTYISTDKPRVWLFNGQHKRDSGGFADTGYSVRSVQLAVKKASGLAGIVKNAHVHTLRHTYATHLLEDGLDIMTLKDLMGHSRIQTTMEYLHVARSNPRLSLNPLDTLFAQCAAKKPRK